MTDAAARAPGHGRVLMRFLLHVAFVACWLLIALMALATWGPHVTRYKTEIIVGQSMEPTIPLWSVIVVEPVDPVDIRKGDIIVAQPDMLEGRKVTHRVTAVTETEDGRPQFQTRGDNNDSPDPWTVVYADGGWRVVGHAPYLGWLQSKAQTPMARVALVALPILFILAQVLRWIWRDEDDDAGDDDHEHWTTWHDDVDDGLDRRLRAS